MDAHWGRHIRRDSIYAIRFLLLLLLRGRFLVSYLSLFCLHLYSFSILFSVRATETKQNRTLQWQYQVLPLRSVAARGPASCDRPHRAWPRIKTCSVPFWSRAASARPPQPPSLNVPKCSELRPPFKLESIFCLPLLFFCNFLASNFLPTTSPCHILSALHAKTSKPFQKHKWGNKTNVFTYLCQQSFTCQITFFLFVTSAMRFILIHTYLTGDIL